LDEPSPVFGLDVGDDGEGGGSEFGVASVVGGEALKKLLKVGIAIEPAGGGSERLERAHARQETKQGQEGGVKDLSKDFRGIAFKKGGGGELIEALGVAEETGGVGSGPKEFIFVELVAVGPAIAAGGGKGLEGEKVGAVLAEIGEEPIEDVGHGEKGRAEVPAESVGASFGDLASDGGVLFKKSDAGAGLLQAKGGGEPAEACPDDEGGLSSEGGFHGRECCHRKRRQVENSSGWRIMFWSISWGEKKVRPATSWGSGVKGPEWMAR